MSLQQAHELNTNCGVSQEEFKIGDIVFKEPYGHAHLQDCIVQWLGMQNACPVGRLPVG